MDLEYIDLQYLDDISELEEDNNEGKREEIIRVPKRYIRVDGAIDCTHVRLTPTRFQGVNEIYRNRKGYFSLNVQAVVGPRTEFLDIVPEWPGSQHDSRIFQNSKIYVRYMTRDMCPACIGQTSIPLVDSMEILRV